MHPGQLAENPTSHSGTGVLQGHVVAHSESGFSERGQLEKMGAGHIFFWRGRLRAERQDADIAFAIQDDIVIRPPRPLQGINDRLITLCPPLRVRKFVIKISVNARPHNDPPPDGAKDGLHEGLHVLLVTVPKAGKLLGLGGSNARVGTDYAAWRGCWTPI
ncbi:hypothetical protein SprV_0200685000 [Sparganum proliferum]